MKHGAGWGVEWKPRPMFSEKLSKLRNYYSTYILTFEKKYF